MFIVLSRRGNTMVTKVTEMEVTVIDDASLAEVGGGANVNDF